MEVNKTRVFLSTLDDDAFWVFTFPPRNISKIKYLTKTEIMIISFWSCIKFKSKNIIILQKLLCMYNVFKELFIFNIFTFLLTHLARRYRTCFGPGSILCNRLDLLYFLFSWQHQVLTEFRSLDSSSGVLAGIFFDFFPVRLWKPY